MPPLHGAAPVHPTRRFWSILYSGMGGLAAPLFVTVFGWGCVPHPTSHNHSESSAVLLSLLAQTGASTLSAPHLFDPFSPGVLTLFRIAYSCCNHYGSLPATKRPNRSHLPFLTILGFSSSSLIFLLSMAGIYSNGSARNETSSASQWIHHALLTGTYPVLPWVVFRFTWRLDCDVTTGSQVTCSLPNNTNPCSDAARGLVSCAVSFTFAWFCNCSMGCSGQLPTGEALADVLPCKCDPVLDRRTARASPCIWLELT